ncbi:hypothetical protein FNV43_RR00766 [Rhamnella rubrinervis]|uniref:Uncharacterized protein n=1 Tax=Rhamnella rubrinervis TaxID=2594499 RepID=A0A8K0HR95_9ROSA|nr:hypothetical protein FNV43_RR00766 [Rhamnella rubrinervis]
MKGIDYGLEKEGLVALCVDYEEGGRRGKGHSGRKTSAKSSIKKLVALSPVVEEEAYGEKRILIDRKTKGNTS